MQKYNVVRIAVDMQCHPAESFQLVVYFIYDSFASFVLNVHTFNRSSKFPAFGRVFHELCTQTNAGTFNTPTCAERQIALVVDEIDTK